MQIKAHPLVVAAAFGLLGPAALSEDDDETQGLGGLWSRTDKGAPGLASIPADATPRLGDTLELIPVDDRLLLEDGVSSGAASQWTLADDAGARQELVMGDAQVVRELTADGDDLTVRTTVVHGDERTVFLDSYTRVG